LKDIAISRWKIPKHKIILITNGIDLANFYAIDRKQATVFDFLPADSFVIGCVGMLQAEKRCDRILKIVKKLNINTVHLIIIGDGAQRKNLKI
jgi:glycosyltransferase involved in cell wall biosynthesis